jgi:hypothetical protein
LILRKERKKIFDPACCNFNNLARNQLLFMKKWQIKRVFVYCIYLFVVTFIALEIILRIYNPFHFTVKYNQIILPVGQKVTIKNKINNKLDPVIVNTKNSLGFRGPERPANFDQTLSIITVGGSTTANYFLSDGRTWTDCLARNLRPSFRNLWINNGGIEGHSTFGHQVLLNDYLIKIRPKVIVFLVGINDVENDQPTFHDKLNIKGAYPDFKHFIFSNSEVLSLGLNLVRGWKAQKMNNTTDHPIVLKGYQVLELDQQTIQNRLQMQHKYLVNFKRRIQQLIDTCLHYNIQPVFLTQPNLIGVGKDSVTGADLEKIKIEEHINGKLLWQMLSIYNDVTIETCRQKNVAVIDLAHLMPKNSLYFYDVSHYTNQGAEKLASILAPLLKDVLKNKFPSFYAGN